MKRGYSHYPTYPPFLKFILFGLVILLFVKALPFFIPLLLIFAAFAFFRGWAFGGCGWHDDDDEKPKRKNDTWDDDEPVII